MYIIKTITPVVVAFLLITFIIISLSTSKKSYEAMGGGVGGGGVEGESFFLWKIRQSHVMPSLSYLKLHFMNKIET